MEDSRIYFHADTWGLTQITEPGGGGGKQRREKVRDPIENIHSKLLQYTSNSILLVRRRDSRDSHRLRE